MGQVEFKSKVIFELLQVAPKYFDDLNKFGKHFNISDF
jgi:hypothetical protein